MTCQTLVIGEQPVTICHGAAHEEVKRESLGVRWCFGCRSRQQFWFIVTAPVVPDYYGPSVAVRCGHCKLSDGDCFPGRYREWDY